MIFLTMHNKNQIMDEFLIKSNIKAVLKEAWMLFIYWSCKSKLWTFKWEKYLGLHTFL